MTELVEEPPYCARMVFVIMSCSCWTDIEAIEVECPCYDHQALDISLELDNPKCV